MSRGVEILQVDAFTRDPFSGNPAGVVLDAASLEEREMRAIAREMNLSETAFLLPPTRPDADLRVRWFAPTVEIDICGHATVATFHAALEGGRLAPGTYRMECRVGVLPVEVRIDDQGRPAVRMGLPVPELGPIDLDAGRLAEAIGARTGDITRNPPMMRAGAWAVVPIAGLEAMKRLAPDTRALRMLAGETGIRSVIALTRETVDPGSGVHVRMFAPAEGIDEDPVTGSAQGPVAAWLLRNRLLPGGDAEEALAPVRYTAEQGDLIGRPGRIAVEVRLEGARIVSITILGSAVTVLRGSIRRPMPSRTA